LKNYKTSLILLRLHQVASLGQRMYLSNQIYMILHQFKEIGNNAIKMMSLKSSQNYFC